ncbi:hypothetical protein J5J01_20755 [Streptomyces fradiae]|uniref:hypothetical protein n=1 Tax=Streptomyces fradiae TaxID=1906 RepID=UPI002019016E|nr:hypothetical protein [Streptomyces fradiae]UQS29368.1 hypothetical protein J5J01_20755 [Streptomyces fradiae]
MGVLAGAGVAGAVGLWIYGVYTMSAPSQTVRVGMRVDGSRVVVKVPVCPADAVGEVEVFDGESEKSLWRARDPKTSDGRRGKVTLWVDDEFHVSEAGRQPSPLPRALDVLVTFAGSEDGTGGYFDMRRVLAAKLPDGQYWTDEGPMTGEAIDAQWKCGASAHSPSAP